jgi:hypothetical protein
MKNDINDWAKYILDKGYNAIQDSMKIYMKQEY